MRLSLRQAKAPISLLTNCSDILQSQISNDIYHVAQVSVGYYYYYIDHAVVVVFRRRWQNKWVFCLLQVVHHLSP